MISYLSPRCVPHKRREMIKTEVSRTRAHTHELEASLSQPSTSPVCVFLFLFARSICMGSDPWVYVTSPCERKRGGGGGEPRVLASFVCLSLCCFAHCALPMIGNRRAFAPLSPSFIIHDYEERGRRGGPLPFSLCKLPLSHCHLGPKRLRTHTHTHTDARASTSSPKPIHAFFCGPSRSPPLRDLHQRRPSVAPLERMEPRRELVLALCLAVVLHLSCLGAPLSTTVAAAASAAVRDSAARSSSQNASITTASPLPFAVFGYLPEYRQSWFNYEAFFKSGLTHLIFFSAEVDPATLRLAHVDDRLPSDGEWARIRRLADLHGAKLMLCIGGGGRSSGFSDLVGDPVRRLSFIEEVNAVLLTRELDGIDFNWEYPQTMTEWLNFGRFLLELRSALGYAPAVGREHAAGLIGERHHRTRVRRAVLSMALHPHSSIGAVLQSARVLRSLDYVHWMAYDHILGTEPHSSVEYAASVLNEEMIGLFNEATYNKRSEQTHQELRTEQDHRRKLTLGIPFYGRHREDRRRQPETYDRLWRSIQQWARKKHPAWVEGGAELRALNNYGGYSFTGYNDVKRKMRLARAANLSGIMIWELGQDVPPGTSPMSLMAAVHEQLADWGLLTDSGHDSGGGVNGDNTGHLQQRQRRYLSSDVAEDGDL